jgi:hypothetical protein
MRGSPPLHLVLLIVLFGALAVPLAKLTFARAKVTMNHEVRQSGKTPTLIRFRFAHPPQSASITLNGGVLLGASVVPGSNVETTQEIEIPKEGIEFLAKVLWPEGTPDTAFSIELEPDGLDTQTQTKWSSGSKLEDLFVFKWSQP